MWSKTYQNSSVLGTKLRQYVDKVAGFTKGKMGEVRIKPHQIKGRQLDLAIPHAGTTEQRLVIEQVLQYGKSKGVTVNVIIH